MEEILINLYYYYKCGTILTVLSYYVVPFGVHEQNLCCSYLYTFRTLCVDKESFEDDMCSSAQSYLL